MRYNGKNADEVIDEILHMPASETDPMGSYTGHPIDEGDTPVQDADDL